MEMQSKNFLFPELNLQLHIDGSSNKVQQNVKLNRHSSLDFFKVFQCDRRRTMIIDRKHERSVYSMFFMVRILTT